MNVCADQFEHTSVWLVFGSRMKVFFSKLLVAIEKLFISVNVGASTHAVTLHFAVSLPCDNMIHASSSSLNYPLLCASCTQAPLDLPRTMHNWLLMLRYLSSSPPCSVQQQ